LSDTSGDDANGESVNYAKLPEQDAGQTQNEKSGILSRGSAFSVMQ
jgi:hypothetical protein